MRCLKRGDELSRLDALAAGQHGVLTRRQVLAAGLRKSAFRRLTRLFPAVYALANGGFDQRITAACLWAGGVSSHRAAARLYGLDGFADAQPELTVPSDRNPKTRGVSVHRNDLARTEVTRVRNIPVTRPVRTLIDLAGSVALVPLAKAVESAWRLGLAHPEEVKSYLSHLGSQGRPGMKALRRVLRDCASRARPLDSPLEVEFWWLLKRARFRMPTPAYEVRDDWGQPMRLDFAFVEERVAVEINGLDSHGSREQFERDNVRSSRIGASHWYMLHFTSRQLEDPETVLTLVAQTLAPLDRGAVTIHESFVGPPLTAGHFGGWTSSVE